jgi:hypothetical protein
MSIVTLVETLNALRSDTLHLQNTYWKLSNPIHYYIKILFFYPSQIEVFIYSFVDSSLGLLVFIPH